MPTETVGLTDEATVTTKGPMPPYIAFKTLTDLIERMEREGPPTRVDPTYLDTYAGGYRPTVILNLAAMGLLEKSGEPTRTLLDLVSADEAHRKALMESLVRKLYWDVLSMPLNSTQGEFLEAFTARGASGDTRRKAISFFLKACVYAGIETGTHWKTPPASSSGTAKRRTVAKSKPTDFVTVGVTPETQTSAGEVVTVDLGEAGSVVVTVDVKWLQLDDDTFTALRSAIKDLRSLAANTQAPAESPVGEADGDEEAES